MRVHRYLLSALIAVCASSAFANTEVKFALDWRFEGPAAPYLVALDKGYYKDEGLNVTIDAGASCQLGRAHQSCRNSYLSYRFRRHQLADQIP